MLDMLIPHHRTCPVASMQHQVKSISSPQMRRTAGVFSPYISPSLLPILPFHIISFRCPSNLYEDYLQEEDSHVEKSAMLSAYGFWFAHYHLEHRLRFKDQRSGI